MPILSKAEALLRAAGAAHKTLAFQAFYRRLVLYRIPEKVSTAGSARLLPGAQTDSFCFLQIVGIGPLRVKERHFMEG